jgi:hypothetical protein
LRIRQLKIFLLLALALPVLLFVGSQPTFGQADPFNRDPRREEEAKIVKDMLAKQQSEREKKDHEELLNRAESALEISEELEKALQDGGHLNSPEEKKLVELEKIVKKIRDDLGGDDDEEAEKEARSSLKDRNDVFVALRKSTIQLVDEVKKTTRFSISAAAIQSSNTVLRLVRLLRFRS